MDIRKTILDTLKAQGKTRYWLAAETGLPQASVYKYLAGEKDVVTESVALMLDALQIKLVPPAKPPSRRR